MITPEFLAMLCCPETHQPLSLASSEMVEELNREMSQARLRNRAGQILPEPLDGGLMRQDGKFLYPIRKQIPVLLIDEAIPLTR